MSLPSVYPVLRYKDVAAAIEFLTTAFGLGEHQIDRDPGDDSRIVHAELSWGTGIVMIGPSEEPTPGHVYLAVDDPDGLHDRAVAAGAEITMPLVDQHYGSREFGAKDPEGNQWSFGTFRPAPTSD